MNVQNIIEAIRKVSNSLNAPRVKLIYHKEEVNLGRILESMNILNSLMVEYNENVEKKRKESKSKNSLIIKEIIKLSSKVSKKYTKYLNTFENSKSSSLLKLIDRDRDENLHSDIIAALLTPSITGQFAYKFFTELIAYFNSGLRNSQIDFINVYREVRLDTIDPSLSMSEIGARRIDLIIETKGIVLVIENKVDTWESDNQTKDYFETVNRGYSLSKKAYLILSPSGEKGECKKFKGISYFDLYEILMKIEGQKNNLNKSSLDLYMFYLNELIETILKPRITSIEYMNIKNKELKNA